MVVNVLGTDIDMSKITKVTEVDSLSYYKVLGTDLDHELYEHDYPRKKFIQTWKNSQVVAKPVLLVLIPFKNLKPEMAGQQMKGLVDWVKGQTEDEYNVICFAEKVDVMEVKQVSIADVDDSTIESLQEKILAKLDVMDIESSNKEDKK